ncbi:FtsX-like permease family [Anaerotruncus sp. 2789STDY5834896]|uniref:FtsX-like permease family n=1 Tax=uncultured Anaerotruncus sp. TaxID=905011 RepID=A0A1C6JW09_9FIRM|nr:FtsX-like permease family [uncultured Anaerotruncus sp.]
MYGKLALRNVRRQVGSYLIYFITVSLTVAMMFGLHNVLYSPQLQEFARTVDSMRTGLLVLSICIALVVAFVLGYATSFMLRLRKREFGTYLTLGMTRGSILRIFVTETMLLGAAALAVGLLLGLFLYQGMMMVLSALMELPFALASYSARGLWLTVGLVGGIFALSALTSALYLKRVRIGALIHGDQAVAKEVRHPFLWLAVALAALGTMGYACVAFTRQVQYELTASGEPAGSMVVSLALLAAGMVLFHIAAARSLTQLILRRGQRRGGRGTSTFLLRQLAAKLGSSAVMAGALAFLMTFAVIGANSSFMQKVAEQLSLQQQYPFDIAASLDAGEQVPYDLEAALEIIGQYAEVRQVLPYQLYDSGGRALQKSDYLERNDGVMPLSQFNALLAELGEPPLTLTEDAFYVCLGAEVYQKGERELQPVELVLGGKTYRFAGATDRLPMLQDIFSFAVVPDAAVTGLPVLADCAAIQLKQEKYDARGLHQALTYTSRSGIYEFERCDYRIREYSRMERGSTTAILVEGALYMAVVFVCLGLAMLALKVLAELDQDRQRYAVLFRLGASRRQQQKTLFGQIFSFFIFPFLLPVGMSVPVAAICGKIMSLGGYPTQRGIVYRTAGAVALVLTAIYILYFSATYLIAKKNILPPRQ